MQAGKDTAAAYVELPDIGTPDQQFTTVLDTSAHFAARQGVIALHRSQTSPYDGLPADLTWAFLASDHLVRVSPAWGGGPSSATSSSPAVSIGGPGDVQPAARGDPVAAPGDQPGRCAAATGQRRGSRISRSSA